MANDFIGVIFALGILAVFFAGLWKSFEKAGIEGWKALIPIYNIYLVVKTGGITAWIMLLLLVPLVNWIVQFYIYYKFAKSYSKGTLFSILTGFFPFIGVPIIGFDSSEYTGNYEHGA